MVNRKKMTSTEIGALWITYQKKTMILRILEHFIEVSEDKKAKKLMQSLWSDLEPNVFQIEKMFIDEGIVIPQGFTKADIDLKAPKLFGEGFDILMCMILKEISMGLYTLHITTSYRNDIVDLYREMTNVTQKYYQKFLNYAVEEGYLPLPNIINVPSTVDFVTDANYMKGYRLLGEKREINTIEFSYLYQSIQTNTIGMELMTGFAQTTANKEVKNFFIKGKELSKDILEAAYDTLIKDNIRVPTINGLAISKSTIPPFSDKLMMYLTFLLSNFGLGSQGFGAGFSLRDDINVKFGLYVKDILLFIRENIKIMIDNGWLEEPPRMSVNNLKK